MGLCSFNLPSKVPGTTSAELKQASVPLEAGHRSSSLVSVMSFVFRVPTRSDHQRIRCALSGSWLGDSCQVLHSSLTVGNILEGSQGETGTAHLSSISIATATVLFHTKDLG